MIAAFRESLSLLGTRRFGTFWFASLLSSMGTWAQQVAEPWLLLTLGASPFLIGLDSFATDAPVWLLTLVGGALADRTDRRRVIAVFQSIQMLCPTAIVVLLITGRCRTRLRARHLPRTLARSRKSLGSEAPIGTRGERCRTALSLSAPRAIDHG